jgi:hypothetical protein
MSCQTDGIFSYSAHLHIWETCVLDIHNKRQTLHVSGDTYEIPQAVFCSISKLKTNWFSDILINKCIATRDVIKGIDKLYAITNESF